MVQRHLVPLLIHRDVAIIFHAHCLSPYRFLADMLCRGRYASLWNAGLAFPIERLHHLIKDGVWSDPTSEGLWRDSFPNPYQLWDKDPTSNSDAVLSLHDILNFVCPWCNQCPTVNLSNFTLTHLTKTTTQQCPSCRRVFNADNLSAQYLKNDLNVFLNLNTARYEFINSITESLVQSKEAF